MKKFILVMVCIIVLAIFIAMNYMLWDRDNKIRNFQDLNSSKSVSIGALTDKIKNLDESTKQQQASLESYEIQNKQLTDTNASLNADKTKLQTQIQNLSGAVSKLKLSANMDALQSNIKKWSDGIDKAQYDVSYKLIDADIINIDSFKNIDSFDTYFKNNVKSMKLKSLKLVDSGIPADKAGNIIFKVVSDINKVEGSTDKLFSEGQNIIYITVGYSAQKNDWVITALSPSL
jgi:uncharacterized protein involved in high-affinity Fe2+ transport